jgi:arylsulfatase A-like enzyme
MKLFLRTGLACLLLTQWAISSSAQEADEFNPRMVIKRPFRAIVNPNTVDITEAKREIRADELVIGITINGESRAYPVNMLCQPSREIVTDVVGGKRIAVTWCHLCHNALVFIADHDGKPLTLVVSGMLWKRNLVMRDQETDSLWSHMLGRCMRGKLKGVELETLPSEITTWADWSTRNPDTSCLLMRRTMERYEKEFYQDLSRFVLVHSKWNDARAWRLSDLAKRPVLNDEFQQQPLLVVYDADSTSARVYVRSVKGYPTLHFEATGEGRMTDRETGSIWDSKTATAVSGELKGRTLSSLVGTMAFEKAFQQFYPKGTLWSGKSKRPNVLFIAIDDLRPELGCYGSKEIVSPNIDALAKTAVTFDRAYCQVAVCNPSRVSIMTGLRPDTTKVWDLVTRFRETTPDAVTIPQQFMKHGYYAASFGKIFHNPWPDNQSWSEPHGWPKNSNLWSAEAKKRLAEHRKQMKADGKSEAAIRRMRAQATEIVDIPDSEHIDGAIADQALNAMRRLAKKDQPFFLAAGFVRPHLPFVVPRKYWDLYDRDKLTLAENRFIPRNSPKFAMNTMYELRDYFDFAATDDPRYGTLTEAQQRRLKHGYFASVSLVDAQVGRLLGELEKLGLAEDTIVVLWGDHGWKLGEHNSWCKQSNYEIDARVPLIIRAPGAKANGQMSPALVEFLDVYPTLCDLAGIPQPKQLEGRSLRPLLADAGQAFKKGAFSQFKRREKNRELMGYAMRTEQHRYVEWLDRSTAKTIARELYDHRVDPQENEDIAGKDENASLIKKLGEQMWTSLDRPKAQGKARPRLTFYNHSRQAITIYWDNPDGEARKVAVVPIGKRHISNTTLGHRFLIHGNVTDLKTSVKVVRQNQTFTLNGGKGPLVPKKKKKQKKKAAIRSGRPNIVFLMADDWSYPHAGILGDTVVKTPNFDRVAREGVLFKNAFVSTPSCTPSRLSILAGQHHWRLREGDSLGGSLREEYDVYTELLQKAGYQIGRYGKGVWPSKHTFRKRDSFGERFNSFEAFVKQRENGKPFCFWFGGSDPHRPYELGIGAQSGIDLNAVKPPACLPNTETVRSDVADYYWEVQRFDRQVGEVIARLEKMGELENTIVVVSGDNGMPFPRCKATLYDMGTRVPLAVRWGAKVKGGRTLKDFVSLCDFAPTFLEAAGLKPGTGMTGKSLLPILESKESGLVDPKRTFALTGMERHVYPYPSRALRTADYLYIRKFKVEKWPTGEVRNHNPEYDFAKTPWPTEPGAFSFNIDPGPAKQVLRLHRDSTDVKPLADLAFVKHASEELYDLSKDPDQLRNVAGQPAYAEIRKQLRRKLDSELIKSDDPRLRRDGYRSLNVEGWAIRVSDKLLQQEPEATAKALELLAAQCRKVIRVLPAATLAKVRPVPIWLSLPAPGRKPTGEYHDDPVWLRRNGLDPAKAKGIEFSNIPIFEAEIKRMPMLLLHELSHAFHNQVLGYEQEQVLNLYRKAKRSGTYDKVARKNYEPQEAYAMSNQMEYFAETTEAYFGENDFYPFNRADLKEHDPGMSQLLGKLWGDREK